TAVLWQPQISLWKDPVCLLPGVISTVVRSARQRLPHRLLGIGLAGARRQLDSKHGRTNFDYRHLCRHAAARLDAGQFVSDGVDSFRGLRGGRCDSWCWRTWFAAWNWAKIVGARPLTARDYALAGRAAEARQALAGLLASAKRQYVPKGPIAAVYAAMGDKDQALAQLEQAYQDRSFWLFFLKVNPEMDSLRSERRFQDLMPRKEGPARADNEREWIEVCHLFQFGHRLGG